MWCPSEAKVEGVLPGEVCDGVGWKIGGRRGENLLALFCPLLGPSSYTHSCTGLQEADLTHTTLKAADTHASPLLARKYT